MEPCPECGFDFDAVRPADVSVGLEVLIDQYRDALSEPVDGLLNVRPSPEVWSGLEYAAHVRDVFLTQRERTFAAIVEDSPTVMPIFHNEKVAFGHYNDQLPSTTIDEVAVATRLLSAAFGALDAGQWSRTIVSSTGNSRTLLWVAQHSIHEGQHHLMDIDRGLDNLR